METLANRRVAIPRRLLEQYIQQAGEAMTRRQTEVGTRIREARDAKGWKQKQLAAAVHVEPITVSRWETGANSPDLGTLELIAQALDRDAAWFVSPGRAPEPEPDRIAQLEAQVMVLQDQVAQVSSALTEVLRRLPADPSPAPTRATSRRRTAAP